MNPSNFTGSITTEDSNNFLEELNNVFHVMHVDSVERVEIDTSQLKNVLLINGMRAAKRMHHILELGLF